MSYFKNYLSIWLSIIFLVIYVTLYYTTGYLYSKFVADFCALVTITFVAAATTPTAFRALSRGVQTGTDKFMMCFWGLSLFTLIQRIWIIFITLLHRPIWLTESIVPGLIACSLAIAAGYGMAAPLNGPGDLPRREIVIMAIAAGISGVVAGAALTIFFVAGWAHY